jgi:signal peptide peptidase SppA
MTTRRKATADPIHPVHRLARQYLSTTKWALRPEMLDVLGSVLHLRSMGVDLSDEARIQLAAVREARLLSRLAPGPGIAVLSEQMSAEDVTASIVAARRGPAPVMGAVAVIPLCGVIDQKIGSMSDISGGTSVDGFMKQFRQCLNDPGVAGIVFDADTPGGNVSGVPEAAAEILAARGTKPIVAVANPMIASAGYYLCCAADEIVCMPSGEVGSIGVLAIHDDFSEQNAMMGYKPTYISYGAYKVELNPDSPLTPDALAYQQQQIDTIGNEFVRFVAKARGVPVDTVRQNFGQGRMLLAKAALAAKMIDRIETLDATIARVGRLSKQQTGAAADAARRPLATVVVPPNVSEDLAPKEASWSAPTLGEFTDAPWNTLSDSAKQRIAGHFACATALPPASFGDLELPHHRASDGKVVFSAIAAAARLNHADPAVRAHLRHHFEQFGEPIPDTLKAEAVEALQTALKDARAGGHVVSSNVLVGRFLVAVTGLTDERIDTISAALNQLTDESDAVALIEALERAQADAEALELTMLLRSRT